MAGNARVYLAIDVGASSGRVVAGALRLDQLELTEVYRFENGGVQAGDTLYWDLLAQWKQIQEGLRAARDPFGDQIVSVGVDTWGVDFGLLDKHDRLLGNPVHYRDRRTEGALERAFRIVPREEIFAATGLQFMALNTLYQLLALREQDSPLLDHAHAFLMMPDLFHWLLTGVKANEFTNATTTQFFNPSARTWARPLLERFGLPTDFLQPIAEPGRRLGRLRPEVSEFTGLHGVDVVLPGTHDTASAVLAVPAGKHAQWCYISSGTWSLMGVEVPRPVVSERCCALNFTNEGGVDSTVRLLKNIAGMWLLQECRRIWNQRGGKWDWAQVIDLAQASPPLAAHIAPDDPRFVAPADMPGEIQAYCRETNQPVPQTEGGIVRCVLESLALRYRSVLEMLEELTGSRLETVHIVGGGSQNELLCQMAADACGRRVVAGPIEATAIGNVMMQAVAAGDVASIAEARDVIRASFRVVEYTPRDTDAWNAAYEKFHRHLG